MVSASRQLHGRLSAVKRAPAMSIRTACQVSTDQRARVSMRSKSYALRRKRPRFFVLSIANATKIHDEEMVQQSKGFPEADAHQRLLHHARLADVVFVHHRH